MKVVILCGGMGTRLKEITDTIPKPLIPIGDLPMVRHIMNHYIHYGHDDFILALGYKQEAFKQYFMHAQEFEGDLEIDYRDYPFNGHPKLIPKARCRFTIKLISTGERTTKAGRLKQLEHVVTGDQFMLTYGDGLSTVDITKLIDFHKSKNALVTLTGVHAQSKFGELQHTAGIVTSFEEKPYVSRLTNGGFMVISSEIFSYLSDNSELELEDIFKQLIPTGRLCVYHHSGFWKNADTLKDIGELREMWDSGKAPWLHI